MKLLFLGLLLCTTFLRSHVYGAPNESQGGGGECDTDLDCTNKGLCLAPTQDDEKIAENDIKRFGKCFCLVGRAGKNCEKKLNEATGKVSKRTRLTNLHAPSTAGDKRALFFHSNLKATGLEPSELGETVAPFLIYNPRTARFVSVGKNDFMVTEASPQGGKKFFKLKKVAGDEFNIQVTDSDGSADKGYLFLSTETKGLRKKSRRVKRSDGLSDTAAYKFKFVDHKVQNGIYKILCDGQTLYASTGGHNFKGDDRESRELSEEIWFQFNFEENKNIAVEKPPNKVRQDVISDDSSIKFFSEVHQNDLKKEVTKTIDKEDKLSLLVTELAKIGFTSKTGIGGKGSPVTGELTVSGEYSEQFQRGRNQDSKTSTTFVIPPGKKVCITYAFRVKPRLDEQQLEITYKGKKFKGYKLLEGGSRGSIEMVMREVDLKDNC